MSLTSLPTEMLYPIFEYAGITESESRLDWLLISKRLFNIALNFLLQDVSLSDRGLRAFTTLLSQGGDNYIIPSKVKRLSIYLKGYRESLPEEETSSSKLPYWPTPAAWSEDTMKNLQILATSLHEFTALESFSLVAAREFNIEVLRSPFQPLRGYLYYEPTFSLLSNIPLGRLNDLTIDTCGSSLLSNTGVDAGDDQHLCPLISRFIHSVQRVRIRMRRICPDIFNLADLSSTDLATGNQPPNLQSIVINLSLYSPRDYLFTTRLCDLCGLSGPCSHNVLVDEMLNAAARFKGARPPGTKVTIVLRSNGLETRSIDCEDGIEKVLADPDEWLNSGAGHL